MCRSGVRTCQMLLKGVMKRIFSSAVYFKQANVITVHGSSDSIKVCPIALALTHSKLILVMSLESSTDSPRYFASSDYVLPSDDPEKARSAHTISSHAIDISTYQTLD